VLITIVTPLHRPAVQMRPRKITVQSQVRADIKCADHLRCRPIDQLRPTAGLWISHTRGPVGDRYPPSLFEHVFRHVRHGAEDLAAALRFMRPSRPRRRLIVQQHAMGRRGGDSPAHRPGADGHCASPVVLPSRLPHQPFCDVSGAPPPAM